jgi:branched-chain amino acid transport system permease protein
VRADAGILVAAALIALAPIALGNPYVLLILLLANLHVVFAASWDILAGYTGQFNFGQALFVGAGAYAVGFLAHRLPAPLCLAAAALAAAVLALAVGLPCLRLRHAYLSLATLVAPLILERLVFTFREVTGGEYGIAVEPFAGRVGLFYVTLAYALGTVLVLRRIGRGRMGQTLQAIREDDVAALAAGIDVVQHKLAAFVICAAFAGAGGGLYAYALRAVAPAAFSLDVSFAIITMGVVGGMGTIIGPAAGAYALTLAGEALRGVEHARGILYAAILLVAVLAFPDGVFGAFSPRRPGYRTPSGA